GAGMVGLQVLGELFNVLTRKAHVPSEEALLRVEHWAATLETAVTDGNALRAGMELAILAKLGIWDAIHLSVAAAAGCEVFLSEDLQHGFRWRGMTVVNPFAHPDHPLLARLLDPQ
ncbi:MAG: PIN domain-containing protein, partial [Terriglobales bacterium]